MKSRSPFLTKLANCRIIWRTFKSILPSFCEINAAVFICVKKNINMLLFFKSLGSLYFCTSTIFPVINDNIILTRSVMHYTWGSVSNDGVLVLEDDMRWSCPCRWRQSHDTFLPPTHQHWGQQSQPGNTFQSVDLQIERRKDSPSCLSRG